MTIAYYNEHDPRAAAWLRELIMANLIAPGEVDERDIQDVLPNELVRFTQCHLFAGVGVWSYALRCAGWPDDRPVWTGSCPCQPFSAAGKRAGTSDERHLWPAFFHLIQVCKPDVVFGEQVAGKDGLAWLDTVQDDLEAETYAVGAVAVPACGFGAPHKRERLFFVADSLRTGWPEGWPESGHRQAARLAEPGSLADAANKRHERNGQPRRRRNGLADNGNVVRVADAEIDRTSDIAQARQSDLQRHGTVGELANADGWNASAERSQRSGQQRQLAQDSGAVSGFWQDAEWIYCRDDKYRPTQPGVFPLAHGVAGRVGRLRGYGNAIVAPVAEEFIRAYLEVRGNS